MKIPPCPFATALLPPAPRIITEKVGASLITTKHHVVLYRCDDNKYYTIQELAKLVGLPFACIRARIRKLPLSSEKILHPGELKKGYHNTRTERMVSVIKWDRSRCRRHKITCTNYSDCQDKRLSLSPDKWVDPGDTSICYVYPKGVKEVYHG